MHFGLKRQKVRSDVKIHPKWYPNKNAPIQAIATAGTTCPMEEVGGCDSSKLSLASSEVKRYLD